MNDRERLLAALDLLEKLIAESYTPGGVRAVTARKASDFLTQTFEAIREEEEDGMEPCEGGGF